MKSIVRSLAVEMALQQRAMGRRIAQLRERSHMTQEIAADKAGVTLRAYQKWEAGGGIQYANLQKLTEVFGVPVEQITGDAETPDLSRGGSAPSQELKEIRDRLEQLEIAVEHQNANLERQSDILDRIEGLVRALGMPEGVSFQDHIVQQFRDAAVQAAADRSAAERSASSAARGSRASKGNRRASS